MAIPLKWDSTAKKPAQLGSSDAIDVDVLSRRGAGGTDMTVGANLGTDELQLGSTTGLARTMHDHQFDGHAYFDAEVDNGNSGTADTIDWTVGNKQRTTITGNVTFTFTAPTGPCNLMLKIVMDGTGGYTLTWPATVKWKSGTQPTWGTAPNAVNIASFYFDGTNYYGFGDGPFS